MKKNRKSPGSCRPNLLVFLALASSPHEVLFVSLFRPSQGSFLLAMSFVKVLLVVLFFMHLKSDNRWYALIFVLPFLLVVPMLIVLQIR
jgi:heme/copper-type cytochrome/quinol oxidase subunit 4